MADVLLPTPRMAYCHALLQFSGHGQQELTFYLPLTALEREKWDCSRLCLTFSSSNHHSADNFFFKKEKVSITAKQNLHRVKDQKME
jgi:hypothetical protein